MIGQCSRSISLKFWNCFFSTFGTIGLLLSVSCSPGPPTLVYRDMEFSHLGTYSIDVGTLEFLESYESPLTEPHVEHLVPLSPSSAVRKWATHVFRPVGNQGMLRITIIDASIIGEALSVDQDFKSLFTTEQAGRYTARLDVIIDILDERHISRAYATGKAETTVTVSEDASLAERDAIMSDLTGRLLKTLHDAVTPQVEIFLAPYLH